MKKSELRVIIDNAVAEKNSFIQDYSYKCDDYDDYDDIVDDFLAGFESDYRKLPNSVITLSAAVVTALGINGGNLLSTEGYQVDGIPIPVGTPIIVVYIRKTEDTDAIYKGQYRILIEGLGQDTINLSVEDFIEKYGQ